MGHMPKKLSFEQKLEQIERNSRDVTIDNKGHIIIPSEQEQFESPAENVRGANAWHDSNGQPPKKSHQDRLREFFSDKAE